VTVTQLTGDRVTSRGATVTLHLAPGAAWRLALVTLLERGEVGGGHDDPPEACARSHDPHRDLTARFPDIAAHWHPTRNGDQTPDRIVAGSRSKAWWLCPVAPDHEWPTTLDKRTGHEPPGSIPRTALALFRW
jgi:hypothetical protein